MKLFNADNNLMTEGNIRKKIIFFAIPVFIGQLFQQLMHALSAILLLHLNAKDWGHLKKLSKQAADKSW